MSPSAVGSGSPVACGPFRIRRIAYPAGYRQPPHSHSLSNLTLVLAGSIRESSGGREEIGSALSLVVKPVGVRHSDQVGSRGAVTLQLAFDPEGAEPWTGVPRHLARWDWLHARPVAAAMLSLLRAYRQASEIGPRSLEDRIVDVFGAIPAGDPCPGTPPAWLRRVKEALDDMVPRSPSVVELARAAGAHPVSVSRAFRRHFGVSITEYRRRQRLRRAATGLEDPGHSLSRIAHLTGYADHPHLTREFREATGVTPSRYRGLTRDGIPG